VWKRGGAGGCYWKGIGQAGSRCHNGIVGGSVSGGMGEKKKEAAESEKERHKCGDGRAGRNRRSE